MLKSAASSWFMLFFFQFSTRMYSLKYIKVVNIFIYIK